MNYGQVIEELKNGKPICRRGWNGRGLFVFKQIPANIGPEIIPKMQSVPQLVKDIIMGRSNPSLNYTNQMAIVNPDGRVDSWVPSVSDIFAEDWQIHEEIICK